jgi:hypothetical protein
MKGTQYAWYKMVSTHSGLRYPGDRWVKNVNQDLGYCLLYGRQVVYPCSDQFWGEWPKIGGLKYVLNLSDFCK